MPNFKHMENDEVSDKRRTLSNQFESIFQRLLSGETIDFYEQDLSFLFEVIATYLLAETTDREYCWYDGVANLTARVRKTRQVEFNGEIWVADDGGGMWKEDFRARVTDKRLTNQGIWITLWVGSSRAEAEVSDAFGLI